MYGTADPAKSYSEISRSPSPLLAERKKIPWRAGKTITVRFPPNPSAVSGDISNLSSDFAKVRFSGEASSYNRGTSVDAVDAEDVAVSENTTNDKSTQPLRSSVLPIFQRYSKLPVQMLHQGTIDGDVIEELRSAISRGGYVYIFKSVDRKLLKIGKATNVARRKQQIKTGCQIEDLEEVDSGSYYLNYPERVERLVHLELQNFRAYVTCQHLHGNSGEQNLQDHREWFDIPEEVAIQAVQRWREVVEKAYTPQGTINDLWARKAASFPRPSWLEQKFLKTGLDNSNKSDLQIHHRLRHKRYQDWMEDKHI